MVTFGKGFASFDITAVRPSTVVNRTGLAVEILIGVAVTKLGSSSLDPATGDSGAGVSVDAEVLLDEVITGSACSLLNAPEWRFLFLESVDDGAETIDGRREGDTANCLSAAFDTLATFNGVDSSCGLKPPRKSSSSKSDESSSSACIICNRLGCLDRFLKLLKIELSNPGVLPIRELKSPFLPTKDSVEE